VRGTVAWDPGTGDPVRLQWEALDPPGPLRELRGRFSYRREHGTLYLVELRSGGLAVFLLARRRFSSTIRFEEIEPAVQR